MKIGRILRVKEERFGKIHTELVMDIRTISLKKKFTIDMNKIKYPDGDMNSPKEGCEDYPDYLLWYNVNAKGEALPREHIGNISNIVSGDGSVKRGFIFDPFIQAEPIYFSIFPVEKEKVTEEGHLFNVLAHVPVFKNQ